MALSEKMKLVDGLNLYIPSGHFLGEIQFWVGLGVGWGRGPLGLGPKDLEHTPPAWHTLTLGERVSIPGLLGRLVVRKLDPGINCNKL